MYILFVNTNSNKKATIRSSLVYYLFLIPMFTKSRGGREVIIHYANEALQSVFI